MAKKFSDLLRDVVFVGAESAREAATQLVHEIQEKSPYWDGYFANEWVVRQGDVEIPAVLKGASSSKAPQEQKDIVPAAVPEPKKVGGSFVYTIGNQMEYRAIAMDLVRSGKSGVLRGELPGATAPLGWFETYSQGGEQLRVLQQATNRAFRALGFK